MLTQTDKRFDKVHMVIVFTVRSTVCMYAGLFGTHYSD